MPPPLEGGAGPTCPSKARVGFADRAVEGEDFPSLKYPKGMVEDILTTAR